MLEEAAALKLRRAMVDNQLSARGISDPRILDAFGKVPREKFVPAGLVRYAYDDEPLPIGEGQTISQPYMVAMMTQALNLKGGEKLLEVGTGSGYQAALLAELGCEVHTIERNVTLATRARLLFKSLGEARVKVYTGDGTLGLPLEAPFDRIIVTAGGPKVPESLKEQLSEKGGVMIIPVGSRFSQRIVRVVRRGDEFHEQELEGCRFVPLIGEEGWEA